MDLGTVTAVITPSTRADLAGFGAGDAFLAGGSWVFSEPQVGVERLFDLTTLGWEPLTATPDGLRIAATCTLAQLASAPVPPAWPALGLARRCCDALRGSFKVWNVATVGGNLCCALAAAPMVSLTAGLDGTALVWTTDGGERAVAVADLITGAGTNALAPGEVLRRIDLPAAALRSTATMRQQSLAPLGRSAALLVGRADEDGTVALTITASVPRPVRLTFAGGVPDATALRRAIDERLAPADYYDDVHGSPPWRRQLTHVLAEEIRAELEAAVA